MTNNNLTDAENIRILEETIEYNNRVGRPTAIMNIYTLELFLDLINRQKAEIERLKEEVKAHIKKNVAKRKYDRALIKAEAYKEFAERVKLEFYYEFDELIPSIMSDKIDNLLKELVCEDNVK